MEEVHSNYFNDETLKKIIAIEGKVLTQIICYMWINRTNPNALLELIDNVELRFADGTKLVITCDENIEGIGVVDDYNYKEEQVELDKEFGGKIKIIPIDASKTEMWKDVPGQILKHVGLTKEGNNYLSDSIMLNFGDERRVITLSPVDGLIIDYYED